MASVARTVAALAEAQLIAGLDELVTQLPEVALKVDATLAAPPARDWPGLLRQLQRAGFSTALTEQALALTSDVVSDFVARDALLRSLFRGGDILGQLGPRARRTLPWFEKQAPPSMCVAPLARRLANTSEATTSLAQWPLELLSALEGDAAVVLSRLKVGAARLFERAHATSLATLWLRSLIESQPRPEVWRDLIEVCADNGELLLADAARSQRPWLTAYLGVRAADRTFVLGIETETGRAARLALQARLSRRAARLSDELLVRTRPELAVAWARSSVGVGERDLDRQAAILDAVVAGRPDWRYATETQLLVASRRGAPDFATALATHVKQGGARAALFIDLLMVQPLEWSRAAQPPPGFHEVAARLLSELQGRPWDLGLWDAARFLLPTPPARRAWAESLFRAHGRQWATALSAPAG